MYTSDGSNLRVEFCHGSSDSYPMLGSRIGPQGVFPGVIPPNGANLRRIASIGSFPVLGF